MTTQEKLQQVQPLSDGQITDADARAGVGSVFSLVDPEKINHFQHVAVGQAGLARLPGMAYLSHKRAFMRGAL